jgi:hypothetical protein
MSRIKVNIFGTFVALLQNIIIKMDKIFHFVFLLGQWPLFISYAPLPAAELYRSKYNTDTAKILIYNAWWSEQFTYFLNQFRDIKRYQLLKERMGYFIYHLLSSLF